MNTEYNLKITDEVTHHFNDILHNSKIPNETEVIISAENLILELKECHLEDYVISHIYTLKVLINMLSDSNWSISTSHKNYILSALQYFVQTDDVIPDNIPVVGLLDDCIVIDIVKNRLTNELDDYLDFSQTAKIYAHDKNYSVDDWKETKRKEVYSRLRHRRNSAIRNRRSRGTSFSIF